MGDRWFKLAAVGACVPIGIACVIEFISPRNSGRLSLHELIQEKSGQPLAPAETVKRHTTIGHTTSYYAAINTEPLPFRRPPGTDAVEHADVCVIGGGLTGLTTALGLAERGKSVVLLESKRVGWNASGRNGGFAIPGVGVEPEDLIALLGPKEARVYYDRTLQAAKLLRKRISDYNIECNVQDAGSLVLSTFPSTSHETEEAMDEINQVLGTSFEFWPAEKCQQLYHSPNYHHAVYDPDAFIVQPLGLSAGLARAAESKGVRIYEDAPAHVYREGKQRRYSVLAGAPFQQGFHVECDNVVLAGSCHLDESLDEKVAQSVTPFYTYIGVTEPLGDRLALAISPDAPYSVCDDITCLNYFRPLPDGRLLWGGIAQSWEISDKDVAGRIQELITENFPALGHCNIDYTWGGDIAMTYSGLPLIGMVKPGVFYATGFGGHGVVPTTMAGEMIAHAIASDDITDIQKYQSQCPLHTVGYPLDRLVVQSFFLFYQLQDFIRSRWA